MKISPRYFYTTTGYTEFEFENILLKYLLKAQMVLEVIKKERECRNIRRDLRLWIKPLCTHSFDTL